MLLSSLLRRYSTSTAAPLSRQSTRRLAQNLSVRSPTPITVESTFPQSPSSLQLRSSNLPPTNSQPPRQTRSCPAMRNFAKYCANCKLTRCPTRPLTSARSSRSSVSTSISSPTATRMWERQVAFHEIDTPDTRPLWQFVRRLPYFEVREAVAKEFEKLTKAGIARPSTSLWGSPVVMVRKKDGG